jgi:ferredoxin
VEAAPATAAARAAAVVEAAAAAPVEEHSPDEAYIETPRCSTCNECTTINSKMFAYNGNQQAYIADVNAGTYAQLVQAAESCQVAIIHPGKPRNPNEPGLEDLVKRAEAFN